MRGLIQSSTGGFINRIFNFIKIKIALFIKILEKSAKIAFVFGMQVCTTI